MKGIGKRLKLNVHTPSHEAAEDKIFNEQTWLSAVGDIRYALSS
jgi:hypothetical protein